MPTHRLICTFTTLAFAAAAAAQAPVTRIAATTLKLPAEGSTAPYKTATALGGLYFEQPVQVVIPPGDPQRTFVVERGGRIAVVRDPANPVREVFLDLSARTETTNGGLLSMAFHPRFAENGFFYVWYSTFSGGQRANRLARFHASPATPQQAEAASETPLITQITGPFGHDGGMLLFGPDGYLYVSVGDGDQNVPEIDAAHQRIDRGFFGGILRLDVDQRPGNAAPNSHPSVHPGAYLVPADNPFIGATSFNGLPVTAPAVRTEFWAVGLRNPWRMAFDPADNRLWMGDVGLSQREEINLITRGGNYGWNFREGTIPGPRTDAPPAGAAFIEPIWDYADNGAASITGGFVYRGPRFPDLVGRYLFADLISGQIWALADTGSRPIPAPAVRAIANQPGITSITYDSRSGDVLFTDFSTNVIRRLVANPNAGGTPLPPTLADTGVFRDVTTLAPAAGVVAYAPNVSFWSDGAQKSRWFALPDTTAVFGFKENGPWSLPAGAVWVKHFELELQRGNPATRRRVETRVLVKTTDGIYGATYRWNDAQTNAALVPTEGATQDFAITETNGTKRTQTWIFPARDNCTACHTDKGGGALSFNTRQLNRAFPDGSANQMSELARSGYLNISSGGPDLRSPAELPALVDPLDAGQSIQARARSYLDANCSQCHQPGGTALGAWDARASTPLSLAGIVNGGLLAESTAGDRVIAPGDATHSMLLRRMMGAGVSRMPPLGSNERDSAGESLLTQCIAELGRPQPPSKLLNLAARAQVGVGANILIPGFVIGGTTPKTVLVRAVGPGLDQFGVAGALRSPALTLFDDRLQPIATNVRWNTAANAAEVRAAAQRVGAFALPENSADSALLVTLAPGAYTAQTAGTNGTGVALVEIYDAGDTGTANPSGAAPRLINTAVRAQVGTGANVLIPGLVVSEGAAKTVLIRAVGPGLAAFGVDGVLARPVITLYAGAESFVTNAGWNNASNAAEIRVTADRVGAFKLAEGSSDSAILVSLSPGAYTVQVSGAAGTSGVALVEVYEVP
jgi:uncharacterized repeat protein (TIGR03806 family)